APDSVRLTFIVSLPCLNCFIPSWQAQRVSCLTGIENQPGQSLSATPLDKPSEPAKRFAEGQRSTAQEVIENNSVTVPLNAIPATRNSQSDPFRPNTRPLSQKISMSRYSRYSDAPNPQLNVSPRFRGWNRWMADWPLQPTRWRQQS